MTPSNVDENDTLYQRIRSGDQNAVAEMIERNTPLVKSRVGKFVKDYERFRYLFDDLVSEGFLALTRVVNSFSESEVTKPTGRMVSEIDYTLKNYVDAETGAGMMPTRTVQRRRSRESLPKQLPFDVAEPPVHLWRNASGHVIRKQIPNDSAADTFAVIEPVQFGTPNNSSDAEQFINRFEQDAAPDLLDTLLACCETEEDETIVRLRIEGYTDKEIGEQLGISRATVGRRRAAIEKRFNERMKKARP